MSKSEQDPVNISDLRVAALKYDSANDSAPIVVAAGAGFIAQKILEIADASGVNIYHDDSAATLLSKLELGRSVPPELYQMVVEIYMSVISAADLTKKIALNPGKHSAGKPPKTGGVKR